MDEDAQAAAERRAGQMHTVAELVFRSLPLSIQAIAVPALSKGWKQWAREQHAKERALEQAERVWFWGLHEWVTMFDVPLWAAQHQQQLSAEQQRFQLRAVAHGDVDAAYWCGGVGVDAAYHARLCESAARFGQLPALQWLRANGCGWNAHTCLHAARGGHLAVLQWARANGCDWDAYTCANAAHYGHLDVLEWARANGCPDDEVDLDGEDYMYDDDEDGDEFEGDDDE